MIPSVAVDDTTATGNAHNYRAGDTALCLMETFSLLMIAQASAGVNPGTEGLLAR
ncbi:MAG: hypothetical protein AVDCRST_MAG18-1790 [uncultured Thermomicrobiales bacterium]|uniref:Uncharacterized protein n=1 Tax=uncultured Thermomicrobiales bacterium TaxID=1645740 RepID=A0A6J4V5P9_9BACT|nr:MAG: hypothetical protein AVDCRST_MAG18-1790 [uncultured Thermomicrobiales bacterium]